jgi:predicted branched-subunit amino acid permease
VGSFICCDVDFCTPVFKMFITLLFNQLQRCQRPLDVHLWISSCTVLSILCGIFWKLLFTMVLGSSTSVLCIPRQLVHCLLNDQIDFIYR